MLLGVKRKVRVSSSLRRSAEVEEGSAGFSCPSAGTPPHTRLVASNVETSSNPTLRLNASPGLQLSLSVQEELMTEVTTRL